MMKTRFRPDQLKQRTGFPVAGRSVIQLLERRHSGV
jgi:hypothetical protein